MVKSASRLTNFNFVIQYKFYQALSDLSILRISLSGLSSSSLADLFINLFIYLVFIYLFIYVAICMYMYVHTICFGFIVAI